MRLQVLRQHKHAELGVTAAECPRDRASLVGVGRRHPDRLPPLRAQLVIGRDLLRRAAVLQVAFLVAAGVVARAGTAELGAHQIAVQLFFFLALVLDAYAIAAQTLVGQALGDRKSTRLNSSHANISYAVF